MDNVIVLNQNLKLDSLVRLHHLIEPQSDTIILSTQFVFENEIELIDSLLNCKCRYINFSDILTDAEREQCDRDAFDYHTDGKDLFGFYETIQNIKNERIIAKFLSLYKVSQKIIVADGLGIRKGKWISQGFEYISLDYYYEEPKATKKCCPILRKILRKPFYAFLYFKQAFETPIFEANKNGTKYLFFGKLDRIGYRIDLNFHQARFSEHIKYLLNLFGIAWQNNTIRLSSFHEGFHRIPDKKNLNVKLIQDGYLPPNYSSNYLYFYGKHTEFYAWDTIGCDALNYHHLPNRIMPFRKKLYLPDQIHFPHKIKKIVCAASGSGDWTAIKNRSDDDRLVWAIGKVAAQFPDIEFIYRCHPTWIHPLHVGVNSINRCAEYIEWLNLPNFKISSHIPNANQNGRFIVSYKRSSFEEDLKDADLVFGEHSIAMIDACFNNKLFASCNMTGHRDFFESITKLGFPHCESVEDIVSLIKNLNTVEFKKTFLDAVSKYNEMTNIE